MIQPSYSFFGVADIGGLLTVAVLFPPGNDVIIVFIMTNNGS